MYQMEFQKTDKNNIKKLYKLNKQLAIDEGQKELFTASKRKYKKAFLSKKPIVSGVIIYKDNKDIGFVIFTYKFATYLAKKVLYIEDIYLKPKYQNKKHINKVFNYIIKKANKKHYCRVELRVLKSYSIDRKILKQNRFFKIKKWDVYRCTP